MGEEYDVDKLLKTSLTSPDFIIDGVHYGRGDKYSDETASVQHRHTTLDVKCWRIVEEKLHPVEKEKNKFFSGETYMVLWKCRSDILSFDKDEILSTQENEIYFYWKGEDALKGYSPLPDSISGNPPVERIVQWAEPPVFLQLFSGTFVVHRGIYGELNPTPHLYLLRGEVNTEMHLYEVDLKKQSLRSRTSFILHFPNDNECIVWHGNQSNSHCRNLARKSIENIFATSVTELEEGYENQKFLDSLEGDINDYFRLVESKVVDYTPRLFYFNNITGKFSAAEIESSHKSEFLTPFPVLQSHLYTADQPAIFLLDDNDEIWIWYGWNRDEDDDFKSDSFILAINYAKCKSKITQKLVRVHKVIAGFEPPQFTNLFPVWKKREDIAQLQEKDGVLPSVNPLIEVISDKTKG